MRLLAAIDNVGDRKDRAFWMTPYFDLAWRPPTVLDGEGATFPIVYNGIPHLGIQILTGLNGDLVADWTNLESGSFETNEHGFAGFSGRKVVGVSEAFAMYSNISPLHVVISDGAGYFYTGRAENVTLQDQGVDLAAFGYWAALSDVLYTALWSDSGPGGWELLTPDDFSTALPDRFENDKQNRLYLAPLSGETFGSSTAHGMWGYAIPHNSRRPIEAVSFTYRLTAPAGWKARLTRHDADWTLLSTEWTLTGNGSVQSGTINEIFTGCAAIALSLYYDGANTAYTGETGAVNLRFTSLRVKTFTEDDLTADLIVTDVVDLVNETNPGQLKPASSLIQSPGIDLPDMLYEDTFGLNVLDDIGRFGDDQDVPRLWKVSVWEDRMVRFAPVGHNGREWFVDAVQIDLERGFTDYRNSFYSTFKHGNQTRRTTPVSDAQSQIRHGLIRQGVADASGFESQAFAENLANLSLAESSTPTPRASLVLTGVYDRTGVLHPLYSVRAGDTMTIRNLPPDVPGLDRIRTFRLKATRYDLVTNILTPVPENDLPTLDIIVSRKEGNI